MTPVSSLREHDAATSTAATPATSTPTSGISAALLARPAQASGATTTAPVHAGGATGTAYRIHSSALVAPTQQSAHTAAVAAVQHAAALAANDHILVGESDTTPSSTSESSSGCLPCSVSSSVDAMWDGSQRLMPPVLVALIGYIWYAYTFRVCIDYILHHQHRPIQAGTTHEATAATIAWQVTDHRSHQRVFPPKGKFSPPVPPTSTAYHPDSRPTSSSVSGAQATDTTPLLRSTQQLVNTSTPNYQATLQNNNARSANSHLEPKHSSVRINVDAHPQGPEHAERRMETLSISKQDGRRRWCDICRINKPDRCHHCSLCDRCVLRMDHHCPWAANCIGYGNHKFFYLFVLYASLLAVWVVVTMIPVLVGAIRRCREGNSFDRFENEEESQGELSCYFDGHWIAVTILAFILALLIVAFTGAHTVYILKNRTTIESLQEARSAFVRVQYLAADGTRLSPLPLLPPNDQGPGFKVVKAEVAENLWDRGSYLANWNSIMGPSWWLWFFPYANTPGDGIHFEYSEKAYRRLVKTAMAQVEQQQQQQQQHGQGDRTQAGASQLGTSSNQGSHRAEGGTGSSQSTLIAGLTGHGEASGGMAVPIAGSGNRRSEESMTSVGSMGRSLPTPRSSPRLEPMG
ncbi:palmitoyltransferase for Vac8p [Dissophora globulifera]|uniref:Palmitoyltransferase n=1 Tax=Dissophora globulifera TaxID=979702 RepID=A0A9P6R3L4_9FUNG|nr:palmitoyltransferase for Vac8p [Dissophora globulifera]